MTLYLRVTVHRTSYVIAAAQVTDVAVADNLVEPATSGAVPTIDCRRLFEAVAETSGYRVQLALDDTTRLCLIVDRLDGLVELGAESFRALPPIGRFGAFIDAVTVPISGEAPALRLHLGSALRIGAPFGDIDARSADAADR